MKKEIKKNKQEWDKVYKIRNWFKTNLKRLIIISTITLLACGVIILVLMLRGSLASNKSLTERNGVLMRNNLTLTDEKTKCNTNLENITGAGMIISDWKVRTEKIMWDLDGVFKKYRDNQDNYCQIYNDERVYWEYKNNKIMEEYNNLTEEYKLLLNEQK